MKFRRTSRVEWTPWNAQEPGEARANLVPMRASLQYAPRATDCLLSSREVITQLPGFRNSSCSGAENATTTTPPSATD